MADGVARPEGDAGMRAGAFTLVEVLIVVIVLGILAAAIVPQFGNVSDDARRGAFVANLRYFSNQCEQYSIRHGTYPPDGGSGMLPAELAGYIRVSDFENGTPVGGVWDTELNENGVAAAIGVHFNGEGMTRDDAYMLLIDEQIDNGDIATGVFRRIAADRYYYVLAEEP
jgi:general secretion pathway protein G